MPPLQSTASVHVNVIDVDDLNPIFEYPNYFAVIDVLAQVGLLFVLLR